MGRKIVILSVIAFIIRPDGSIGGRKENPTEEDIEKLKACAIAAGKDYRVGWLDGNGIAVKRGERSSKMKYYFDTKYRLYIEAPIEQEGENLIEITKEQWLEALELKEHEYEELKYKRVVKRDGIK